MSLPKYLLWFIGGFTVFFGLTFVFMPHYFFEMYTGGKFPTTSAAIDVRSTYGGFSLGMGLFLFWCSKNNIRAGLTAALLALACIIPARILGLLVDGSPNNNMFLFLGLEVVSLLAVLLALRKK